MVRVRSNRVCFTVNNYDETDYNIVTRLQGASFVKYVIVGEEIGENGTPHLQGFIHVDRDPKLCGIKWWKDFLPFSNAAHFENARGRDADSQNYCSKEGPYFEYGEPQAPAATIQEQVVEDCKTLPLVEIYAKYPFYALQHAGNIARLVEEFQTPTVDAALPDLRPWQLAAMEKLKNQSQRRILFVVDEEGGKGKSALAKHILTTENTWACQGGKINDLMYAYDVKAEYVVFDMARCNNPDYYPWNFMENLKNGWFTSTKYKGGLKTFVPPKICVFMNQMPPMGKLSHDRYEIYTI